MFDTGSGERILVVFVQAPSLRIQLFHNLFPPWYIHTCNLPVAAPSFAAYSPKTPILVLAPARAGTQSCQSRRESEQREGGRGLARARNLALWEPDLQNDSLHLFPELQGFPTARERAYSRIFPGKFFGKKEKYWSPARPFLKMSSALPNSSRDQILASQRGCLREDLSWRWMRLPQEGRKEKESKDDNFPAPSFGLRWLTSPHWNLENLVAFRHMYSADPYFLQSTSVDHSSVQVLELELWWVDLTSQSVAVLPVAHQRRPQLGRGY